MVPVYVAKILRSSGWRLRDTMCVPHSMPERVLVQNVKPANSAVGTTPSPREAVSPFNFSGDSRSYTMLGKRAGKEQRKVTLANDHTVQMWTSRHEGQQDKTLNTGQTPGALCSYNLIGCRH